MTPSANDLSNVTYTWLVGGQDVQDGSSNTYTPTAADVGKTLDVLASFTDPVTHSVEHVTALGGTVDATRSGHYRHERDRIGAEQCAHAHGGIISDRRP
jgi:hypothetical protein